MVIAQMSSNGRGGQNGANGTEAGTAPAARRRFVELMERCESALMRAALRLCRGGHDCAQELVQEALVRAYEAFRKGQFREGAGHNPQAWFLRIMTNYFINEHRRKRKWEAGVDVATLTAGGEVGPPSTHAASGDQPESALLARSFDEPLEKALLALPDALRQTVLLVDVDGLSYDEAASELKIPVGTVRSRLSRARYTLAQTLHEWAHDRRRA